MAKLILSMEGLVLKEIVLTRERTTIGRRPHNDIQIDNLAISGEHAALVIAGDEAVIEDLDSTNGTYVNGQGIKKQSLRNNDVIELGKYRLKYLHGPLGAAPGPVAAPEATHRRAPDPGAEVIATQRIVRPQTPVALGVIEVLSGSQAGRKLELHKPATTLGRPGVQVAVISRRDDGYFIAAAEGPAPLVNGDPVQEEHALRHRDVIELGGVKMEFYLRSA